MPQCCKTKMYDSRSAHFGHPRKSAIYVDSLLKEPSGAPQALFSGAYFGVGNGLGMLLGGVVYERYGSGELLNVLNRTIGRPAF
jgi:hypothetical protein